MQSNKETMIQNQLIARGIKDKHVIDAIRKVPRDRFIGEDVKAYAYEDTPLKIGHEQTISQPYMVAYMTEALDIKQSDTILEIGTGSGYQTAILAELASTIYTIERVPELSKQAKSCLDALSYTNITFVVGDGTKGYKKAAPYDKIIVTAAPESVPQTLLNQLKDNGKLIIPVGGSLIQDLMLYTKQKDAYDKTNLGGCRFVPLVNH